ncbi:MAG: BlaI/MecI/CopY family transcriptional regulator [Gemmataceae bacterium]
MAIDIPSLGELEVQVLRLVWRLQPCTERQISDAIQAERAAGRTTVLKTVQRLEAKGVLRREAGAGPIRYRAALAERRVLPALIGRFVSGFLGGSAEPLVAFLGESEQLSARDLEQLKAIARKLRSDEEKPK